MMAKFMIFVKHPMFCYYAFLFVLLKVLLHPAVWVIARMCPMIFVKFMAKATL